MYRQRASVLVLSAILGGCGASSSATADGAAPLADGGTLGPDAADTLDASRHPDAVGTPRDSSLREGSAQDGTAPEDVTSVPPGDARGIDATSPHDAGIDSPFGLVMGTDPCFAKEGGSAWSISGRCNAFPRRTPVVSTQAGTILGQADLSFGSRSDFNLGEAVFAPDGTVYVMGNDLYAIDPSTLAMLWEGPTTTEVGLNPPVLGPDGTLYLSNNFDNNVIAVTAAGAVKWTRALSIANTYPIILADGTLVYSSYTAAITTLSLQALHGSDGTDSWTLDLGPGSTYGTYASLVASSTGTLYALTAAGVTAISAATQQVEWTVATTVGSAALDEANQLLYFVSEDPPLGETGNFLVSSFATDGSATSATLGTFNDGCNGDCYLDGMALGEGGWIYVSATNGVYAFRGGAAPTSWTKTGLGYPSAPVVGGDGTVYVAYDGTDGVYLDAYTADGTTRWTKQISTEMPYSVDVGSTVSIDAQGRLYVVYAENEKLFQLGP